MKTRTNLILPIALGLLVLAGVAPAGAAAATDLTMAQAELRVISLLNQQRAAAGRVALRVDPRVTAVARARSADMAAKDYFAHQQPDGRWAWDLLTAAGITWYGAGEDLAFNYWGTLAESAAGASKQWHDSPPHYAALTDTNYNYVGVGLAIDGDKKIWTAVFIKGPDRTGPTARLASPVLATTTSSGTRAVTIKWSGSDVRLSVLTAGLQDFRLQRRVVGGTWSTVYSATTATSVTMKLSVGTRYEFRVRSRDRKGNLGSWTAPITVDP